VGHIMSPYIKKLHYKYTNYIKYYT